MSFSQENLAFTIKLFVGQILWNWKYIFSKKIILRNYFSKKNFKMDYFCYCAQFRQRSVSQLRLRMNYVVN